MSNITVNQLKYALRRTDKRLDALEAEDLLEYEQPVAFTIPASGWGSDSSVSDFPYYYDVAVAGLSELDVVAVTVAPGHAVAARAANFSTVQSYTGKFRLRCKTIPTVAIAAEYSRTNTFVCSDANAEN